MAAGLALLGVVWGDNSSYGTGRFAKGWNSDRFQSSSRGIMPRRALNGMIGLYGGLGYFSGSQWELVSEFISDFRGLLVGVAVLDAGLYLLV